MQVGSRRLASAFITALAVIAFTGCGGNSDTSSPSAGLDIEHGSLVAEAGAPAQVGDTSTDGLNWFNFRREQAGLSILTRHSLLDSAARKHSEYQRLNGVISHEQQPGSPGFTGASLGDRLKAESYPFQQSSYAYGEVISASTNPSGVIAADALVTAIYHRFVILEPIFTHAGAGRATEPGSYTWFTTNFAADGLSSGLGEGRFITWPVASQTNIPRLFMTDSEIPDPLPEQNAAGYPVSIHADITSTVSVDQFTLRQSGGTVLPARLLSSESDSNTAESVAAIVPLSVLSANTVYEAHFIGRIDGVPVDYQWRFTTTR